MYEPSTTTLPSGHAAVNLRPPDLTATSEVPLTASARRMVPPCALVGASSAYKSSEAVYELSTVATTRTPPPVSEGLTNLALLPYSSPTPRATSERLVADPTPLPVAPASPYEYAWYDPYSQTHYSGKSKAARSAGHSRPPYQGTTLSSERVLTSGTLDYLISSSSKSPVLTEKLVSADITSLSLGAHRVFDEVYTT